MSTVNEMSPLMVDLAASWTDSVLEILKMAGIRNISVDMEVEAWRTLKKVLQCELRWQRSFRMSMLASVGTLMEHVLRRAALLVVHKYEPGQITYEFEKQVRRLAGDQQPTPQSTSCINGRG